MTYLREQRCEGTFFQKMMLIILRGERINPPMIDGISVPWFVLPVLLLLLWLEWRRGLGLTHLIFFDVQHSNSRGN